MMHLLLTRGGSVSDCELIELSARSIGLELSFQNGSAGYYRDFGDCVAWLPWDPIVDGADAMRLVVQHGMQINAGAVTCRVGTHKREHVRDYPVGVNGETDVDLATQALCRAIAEVAVDIYKAGEAEKAYSQPTALSNA
ncbi:hypothetical protein ACIQUF_11065 [Pseudomonas sp. NPDC090233]|uniref:hypothetical protein n=1 Tax=Pseudomonas sp. NPDC090233 TaxID=3364479 RepID=UPI00383BC979